MSSILEDPTPLQPNYLPRHIVGRKDELEAINAVFAAGSDTALGNVFVHGSRGTGKTHLIRLLLDSLPDTFTTCYVPCNQNDTQYKVLKQFCQDVTREQVPNGYHTAQLQRQFEQHCSHQPTVVVLDDIEFLLLNDGDDLLYSLSRNDYSENIGIIPVSANHEDLVSQLEARTYSSLYPQRIEFEPYDQGQLRHILKERAQKALAEHSLHREALHHITSNTSNASLGLTWLKTAAQNTNETITEHLAKRVETQALQKYADRLLTDFTEHHRLLYQAIHELSTEHDTSTIETGQIYDRYQDLCQTYSEDSLSNRRISDYLKHLELLNLIEADYHYGGRKGKTREISLMTIL